MSSEHARPAPAPGPDVRPGFVLVVDDEPLLLRALARILGPDGHRVVLAETPAEAQPALARPRPRRGAAGPAPGRRQRPRPARGDQARAARGGGGRDDRPRHHRERGRLHAGGAFDYLAKPFDDVHRVRTTVHQAIERRRLLARNRELEARLEEGRRRGPS
jgi:CheY-like chemotaxis protein